MMRVVGHDPSGTRSRGGVVLDGHNPGGDPRSQLLPKPVVVAVDVDDKEVYPVGYRQRVEHRDDVVPVDEGLRDTYRQALPELLCPRGLDRVALNPAAMPPGLEKGRCAVLGSVRSADFQKRPIARDDS